MSEYSAFLKEVATHNQSIVLYAVSSDERLHPCATDISVLFIRDCVSNKTFTVNFNHPDFLVRENKQEVIDTLSSLNNRKWAFDKKSFLQLLPVKDLFDINLYKHLWEGVLYEKETFQTNAHKFIYRGKHGNANLNLSVPILKHKEMFDQFCDKFILETAVEANVDVGFRKSNSIILETLSEIEQNGIFVNKECFQSHFDAFVRNDGLVFSQYNIYTSTGRPSNHFDHVNYAALNKENGARKCFVSRYGKDGKMVLIDYSAFHPRIITHLVNFPLSIDIDIYKYLGEMYFGRPIVSDVELDESKKLTFKQLYGGVEEQFEHIKYFARLKNFIQTNWEKFEKDHVVLTPLFKRAITDRHLVDANPSKLFNYILQATETEIAIPAVHVVNQYLRDKKTKAILYTYDSILFDFHREDGQECLQNIMMLMKMNNRFPIKVYVGDSYDSVSQFYS
jgi:hypothetical protein